MIALPHKVTLNLEGISIPDHFRCTEKLALAYDSRNAMHNVLSVFCGIRAKSERDRLIQSGHVKCVKVYPYWVFDERERERGVFAILRPGRRGVRRGLRNPVYDHVIPGMC